MKIKILNESGYLEALYGLSLSYGVSYGVSYETFVRDDAQVTKMFRVLMGLKGLDRGHNKALESICMWIELVAPRNFYQQLDAYRIGISKQSESTEHTILKRKLSWEDFDYAISQEVINLLNKGIEQGNIEFVKAHLPESFLQKRIICTNYKTLRNILVQRKNHRMPQWNLFCSYILENAGHKELFDDLRKSDID